MFIHRFLDIQRRLDVDDFDAFDPHAPFFGGFVQGNPDIGRNFLASGQGFVQLHLTDNLTQGRRRDIADPVHVIGNTVSGLLRSDHLIEDNRIDLHLHIILGDYGLRRNVRLLDPQIMVQADLVDDRDQDVKPRRQQTVELPEPLNDSHPLLRHDFDGQRNKYDYDYDNNGNNR
ncbi:hypothetical protein D1872_251360 [compost metagenome]